jgi:probable HAF family extracellular repeat protein
MIIMNRIITTSLIIPLALGAAACSDGNLAGPDDETTRRESPGIVLSNSRLSSTTSAASNATGGIAVSNETGVVHVSVAPQTLPNAVSVEIRNRTTGGAGRLVPIIEGGFDPVQIEASAGDDLELTISSLGGGTTTMSLKVPGRRPPVVVRSNPPSGRIDVALNQVLVVIFSEPIEPKTLNISSLRLLRDGQPVSGTIRLSQNGWEADFVPDGPLQTLTSYDLVVTRDIRDLDGDALDASYTVKFTTTGDSTPTAVPATVTISVDQSRAAAFLEGSGEDTITATAFVKDAAGNEVTSGSIVWYAPSGATITPTGPRSALFTIAWYWGTATFAATIGGVRGTLDITVRRRPEQAFIWTRESGMVAIPLPAGITSMTPTSINDRGEVVGTMTTTEDGPNSSQTSSFSRHAFIWSASIGLRDLRSLGVMGSYTVATAINALGQVTGFGSSNSPQHAFRWSEESGVIELTQGQVGSLAYGINASGYIVGERANQPFRWSAASGFEILAVDTAKYQGASARAINDAGLTVGWLVIDYVNDVTAGILWNPDGEQLEIPGPDLPIAINNRGQVAGGIYGSAFRWTRADGRTPFPISTVSRVAGINDTGDIVGQMCRSFTECRYMRGFLWAQSGTVTDLGLLPGALETVATGINNNGQVVGYSR